MCPRQSNNLLVFSSIKRENFLTMRGSQKRTQLSQCIACLLSLEIFWQRLDEAWSRRKDIVKRTQNSESYKYRFQSQLVEICFKIIRGIVCGEIQMIKSGHKLMIIWLWIMGVHWTILFWVSLKFCTMNN